MCTESAHPRIQGRDGLAVRRGAEKEKRGRGEGSSGYGGFEKKGVGEGSLGSKIHQGLRTIGGGTSYIGRLKGETLKLPC